MNVYARCSMKLRGQLSFRLFGTATADVQSVVKIINDHPFPRQPLWPVLLEKLPPGTLSGAVVEDVLGRLFSAHCNGLKALELFRYASDHSPGNLTPGSFEKTLHILSRMRYFDKAWELMREVSKSHPTLLTLKSMSILLSKIARYRSFEETLVAFETMENEVFKGRIFGTDEFNVLLRALCAERKIKEARSVFNKLHPRFKPDVKTMNILLLGFKESGDITSVELFYHEMVRRGFTPNSGTYGIRIDTYCKRGCLGDGLRLLEEMERAGCLVTVQTMTTLIHGAGVARNVIKARELFKRVHDRNMEPDTGCYNAMMSTVIRLRDIDGALSLMDEMVEKGIKHDNMTYHTMYLGLMKSKGVESVCELYHKMIDRNFVPKTRTVVMLMKFFCINCRFDMGLHLWEYTVTKGHCPHAHALDLLVTGLGSRGRTSEAYACAIQMLERGRQITESTMQTLQNLLSQAGETEKQRSLNEMVKKLQEFLPASTQDARKLLFT
ncbi:hypothetical protein MLD38_016672 [Melastoma candidum]|uniref:Uncharacterized protein n=2 Tax=Melastoma candidum TaxID=119954 RepID=A0ACB9QMJ8_9MYRT|nr:hypothetical protein MLD38_016672 [Melastoma candidum]